MSWEGVFLLSGASSDRSNGKVVGSLGKRKEEALRMVRGTRGAVNNEDLGQSDSKKAKVVVIAGPTAVGKTSLALALAKLLGGEIVSADSVQVYKGLDVGSAKTPFKDRHGIPHHLVDIIYPTDEYAAGTFFDDAREVTNKVLEKGLVPIVVGGTGMYLRWYINGKPGTPKSSQQQVAAVEEELSELMREGGGWDDAVKLLAEAGDPQTAHNLTRNDWYRLRRSLEIVKATGQPRTDFAVPPSDISSTMDAFNPSSVTAHGSLNSAGQTLDYDFRCYFLYKPRVELYRQIDLRCEQMVVAGLLQEASMLLDSGIQPNSSSPSRAIGYRQAMEFLSECRARGGIASEEQLYDFLATFQKASRNFVRRQLTWFRSEPHFQWIDASQRLQDITRLIADDHLGLSTLAEVDSRVKEASYKEGFALKHYKTKLKVLNSPDACGKVIDWIRQTQTTSVSGCAS